MLFPIFFVIKGYDDANFMYNSITLYIFYSYHPEDVKHRVSTISLFLNLLMGRLGKGHGGSPAKAKVKA